MQNIAEKCLKELSLENAEILQQCFLILHLLLDSQEKFKDHAKQFNLGRIVNKLADSLKT